MIEDCSVADDERTGDTHHADAAALPLPPFSFADALDVIREECVV